jgi:hypothetical protein
LVVKGRPRLIDPASIDLLHWALDIARLSVDLLMSAWDAGDESQEWNSFATWQAVSRQFLEGTAHLVGGTPNSNVAVALNWLRNNLYKICSVDATDCEWEFRLAIAIEFLRASYRYQDLPSPKRVLGLVAACDAIRLARNAWEEARS